MNNRITHDEKIMRPRCSNCSEGSIVLGVETYKKNRSRRRSDLIVRRLHMSAKRRFCIEYVTRINLGTLDTPLA